MYIIIDCSNICYAAAYTLQRLSMEEKPTGILFGFLMQVLALSKRFSTNRFIFCWDSRKSYRKLIYPEYKEGRRKDLSPREREDLQNAFIQFDELREKVLPALGFRNNFLWTGYEADDLMAVAAYEVAPGDVILVSSDNDLWQLLDSRVSIYSLKKKALFTEVDFFREWGVPPAAWVDVKVLAGCPGDNVKGIEGVGPKTAVKYIANSLGEGKIKSRIDDCVQKIGTGSLLDMNTRLVKLPFRGVRPLPDLVLGEEKFRSKDFVDVFDKYGFASFLTEKTFSEWQEGFDLR